jgi:hypothetical protein
MKIRVLFGQPVEENGEKEAPVVLEAASGDDADSNWFQKEMFRWESCHDYTGFAVVDIEVDEAKIKELCSVQTVPGAVVKEGRAS